MNRPRFEVVQTDAEQPWHARWIAGNGEPVWFTENYADDDTALEAIRLWAGEPPVMGAKGLEVKTGATEPPVEVRYVDERQHPE